MKTMAWETILNDPNIWQISHVESTFKFEGFIRDLLYRHYHKILKIPLTVLYTLFHLQLQLF